MTLTVLSVAYPFAPVTADPVGGAEQVLSRLDHALVEAGHRSIVIATEGSAPAGEFLPLPAAAGEIDRASHVAAHGHLRLVIAEAIRRFRPDVIHLHGIDFPCYLPPGPTPALATLHLPLDWYPAEALVRPPQNVWLAPVSRDQARRAPDGARLIAPIENGVEVDAFRPCRKRPFALALGRICPEKGFHLALDAARQAGMPMLLAGTVFPHREHRLYFEQEIRPRLDRWRRWIGPVAGANKRKLLASATCLIAPSLAPETSSLVAREALAAGTPVVALRAGALAEVVEPGRTGVLVDTPDALAEAIGEARALSAETCRSQARARFSARRMVERYFETYRRLAAGEALPFDLAEAA